MLWLGKMLDVILIFLKFTEVCFVDQHVVNVGECSLVHMGRMCILLLLNGMLYQYQLSLSDLTCYLRSVFPYLFSG